MTLLADVISVSLNVNTLHPQFPGFGIPLIVGKFKGASVAMVDTITVNNALNADTYVATLNGVNYTYTATVPTDTTSTIAASLGLLLAADLTVNISVVNAVITVTAVVPGTAFTLVTGTETGSMTVAAVTVNYVGGVFGGARYRQYSSLSAVAVDFPQTSAAGTDAVEMSKIYKMANAIFSQPNNPPYIYVGRFDTTGPDASYTAALTAISAALTDFYAVAISSHSTADIESAASWTESNSKMFGSCSENSAVLSAGGSDEAITLAQASYNRSWYMWHWQSGVDASLLSGTASVGGTQPNYVITITSVAHGLRVGDPISLYGFTNSGSNFTVLNGDNIVATIVNANSFTVNVNTTTTLAAGAISQAFSYYARYTFPECALFGARLPTTPGSYNWNFTNLVGIQPSPVSYLGASILTEAQEKVVLGKNGNVYTALGGVGGTRVGTLASGRFIDIEWGLDWLSSNIQQSIYLALIQTPKIPYTDAGMNVIRNAIASVLTQAIANGVLGPLIPPVSNSGELYRIIIPPVSAQSSADRQARVVRNVQIVGQLAGAVNTVSITLNATF